MFGTELALIQYLYEREMSRRRAVAEREAAQRHCDESGVRLRPQAPVNAGQLPRVRRGLFG